MPAAGNTAARDVAVSNVRNGTTRRPQLTINQLSARNDSLLHVDYNIVFTRFRVKCCLKSSLHYNSIEIYTIFGEDYCTFYLHSWEGAENESRYILMNTHVHSLYVVSMRRIIVIW